MKKGNVSTIYRAYHNSYRKKTATINQEQKNSINIIRNPTYKYTFLLVAFGFRRNINSYFAIRRLAKGNVSYGDEKNSLVKGKVRDGKELH